jgi:uncharacterized Fe-S cluster-containing radical SAM superfamily protein
MAKHREKFRARRAAEAVPETGATGQSPVERISGTREWAAETVNLYIGCSYGCRYCYAREMARRFGRESSENCRTMVLREGELTKKRSKVQGRVMFPSTHDITPETLEPCLELLGNLLAAGNEVLIVTKPHLECLKAMMEGLEVWHNQVTFRFTITCLDEKRREYWEPGAPTVAERLEALAFAFGQGWKTGVSVEPMLHTSDLDNLVRKLLPLVTDTLWLGKMNEIPRRVSVTTDADRAAVGLIIEGQCDFQVLDIYMRWRHEPRIRWKDSIKKVVGLALASAPGEDV